MTNLHSAERDTLLNNIFRCYLLLGSRVGSSCFAVALCIAFLLTLEIIPTAYASSGSISDEKIWCATAETTKFTTRVYCLDYWDGKVFATPASAAAEHRRLKYGNGEVAGKMWCATAETTKFTTPARCLDYWDGRVFATPASAAAEHRRLKDGIRSRMVFLLAIVVLLLCLAWRGYVSFDSVPGDEYGDRREQDEFRYEHHDGWEEDDLRYEYHDSSEENDFGTEYGDGWEEDNTPERQILDEDHRKQLKQLFRRAAQFCHPDKVPDHVRDAAHELFTQLNAAFQANDIEGVRNISDIARSGAFANPSR